MHDKDREQLQMTKNPLQPGQWKGPVPLPPTTRLASRVTSLEGEQEDLVVDFLACCLA